MLITDTAPSDHSYQLLSLFASIGVRPREEMEQRGNKAVTTDGYWIVKKGDIVVNKLLAWMGAIGLSAYEGVTSPAYDVIRKKNKSTDERYFDYLFRTETSQKIFKRHSRGIMEVRLRLYFDKLGALTVPVPPFAEQQAIADYLDTRTAQIDRKIELLRQKAEKYRQLKQSIINETVTRGLDPSAPMKDSGVAWIGQVPAHWGIQRLKDVADLRYSNVDKLSKDDEIPVELCNYTDVYKNDFITPALPFMAATANSDEIKRFVLRKHDVLVTKDSETADDIAVPALVLDSLPGVLCGYHLAQIRAKQDILYGPYLHRLFQSDSYGHRFVTHAKGITRVGLSISALSDAITPLPPLVEQVAISEHIDEKAERIDNVVAIINFQIEKLQELRKALINDVVTGKLRVV